MITFFKDLIFAWRYKRAVKKADKLAKIFGMKYLVLYWDGSFKVVPKQNIRKLVAQRRFQKGIKAADIERKALYVTH